MKKINWFMKLLLKFWPTFGIKILARKQGIKNSPFEQFHSLFSRVERVDIFPYSSGSRGFIIIINQNTAFYFNQDGDHFVYDGFEVGKYDKGNITIFDNIKDE